MVTDGNFVIKLCRQFFNDVFTPPKRPFNLIPPAIPFVLRLALVDFQQVEQHGTAADSGLLPDVQAAAVSTGDGLIDVKRVCHIFLDEILNYALRHSQPMAGASKKTSRPPVLGVKLSLSRWKARH